MNAANVLPSVSSVIQGITLTMLLYDYSEQIVIQAAIELNADRDRFDRVGRSTWLIVADPFV